jgi:thiamine pyrophosphokinase
MTPAPAPAPVHAAVLADGDPVERAQLDVAWPGWADGIGVVVAADGGARLGARLGLRIDAWVGDGDSLPADELASLERAGVDVHRADTAKDESDAELAVLEAIRRGATEVTILGALGGPRFDHALANVALLGHPALGGRVTRILGPTTRIGLIQAPGPDGGPVRRDLTGRIGDIVSLLPIGDVTGVTTFGFEYPLHDEPLSVGPARGLSNVRRATDAAVEVRAGRLLVVEVPALDAGGAILGP